MKLQNEEVRYAQKLLKLWLIKWTDQYMRKWETSQKKAFCNINIEKVEILRLIW